MLLLKTGYTGGDFEMKFWNGLLSIIDDDTLELKIDENPISRNF